MFLRNILVVGILIAFLLSGLFSIYAVVTNTPLKESILAVVGFIGIIVAVDQLWDRFHPIAKKVTRRVPSEKAYLKWRLQEFQKEEALFV